MNTPHSSGGFFWLSKKQVSHSPKRQTKGYKRNSNSLQSTDLQYYKINLYYICKIVHF